MKIGQITELGIRDFLALQRTGEQLETNCVYVPGRHSKWNHLTLCLTFQEGYAVNGEILTAENGTKLDIPNMQTHLEDIQGKNIFITVWNFTYLAD